MREIKFRAWAKNTKEMFYSRFDISSEGKITHTYGIYDKSLTLMQYTGLKDKNGKEIYEGDIIGMPHPAKEGMCWEVLWHDFGWQILLRGMEDTPNYYVNVGEHLEDDEVIGNIYEHAELSEGDK